MENKGRGGAAFMREIAAFPGRGAVMTLSKTFDFDNADCAGIILEAMSFSGYYDIVPQYKEIALKTKTARDNESSAMPKLEAYIDDITELIGSVE